MAITVWNSICVVDSLISHVQDRSITTEKTSDIPRGWGNLPMNLHEFTIFCGEDGKKPLKFTSYDRGYGLGTRVLTHNHTPFG